MICIYHNKDLDGYCSGAIVKKRYPEAKLIGYDYGKPFPWDKIPEGSPVIMIDVSLPMADMARLSGHTGGQFTWIDHHATAITEYEEEALRDPHLRNIDTVLEVGRAACEIGWEYLFPDDKIPFAVLLLGVYDTWRKDGGLHLDWDNVVLPFQFGMRQTCNSPETFPDFMFIKWGAAYGISLSGKEHEIVEKGKAILEYQASINQTNCRNASFEIEFDGLRAICLNGGGFNSDVFKSVYDPEKHDVMMPFQFNGKFWVVSLYTTKTDVDCGAIAKSHGGGGHKQAAGFQVNDITEIFTNIAQIAEVEK